MNAPLYNRIKSLDDKAYPLHMPGHKRNTDFIDDELLKLDITEIDGTDNMHCPTDVILKAERELAKLNKSDESLFLVNGGSSGVLTAVFGTLYQGDEIIICSNAHKSVNNALVLSGAIPVYISPEQLYGTITGSITPQQLQKAFSLYPKAKSVLVTSPTYEGFTADIKALSDITHRHGAIMIVDETHGAHFAFSKAFPTTAMEQGADISINSWHKTLPCPNQSAVININTQRVDISRLKIAYSMVQTTSPSYIMMCIMDKVRAMLTENTAYMTDYTSALHRIRQKLSLLKNLRLADISAFNAESIKDNDIGKLVILTGKNFDGNTLAQMLAKDYNIQVELSDFCHIIAMTSVADDISRLEYFADVLLDIDKKLPPYIPYTKEENTAGITKPVISPRQAFYSANKTVELSKAIGCIAGECITPFPPDIPLLITGERITSGHISLINKYLASGTLVLGIESNKIKIIEENYDKL